MFGEFYINKYIKAAQELAVEEGALVNEEGVLLNPSTIKLVSEIEGLNIDRLIDQSLETGNRELFMQLTNQKEEMK